MSRNVILFIFLFIILIEVFMYLFGFEMVYDRTNMFNQMGAAHEEAQYNKKLLSTIAITIVVGGIVLFTATKKK